MAGTGGGVRGGEELFSRSLQNSNSFLTREVTHHLTATLTPVLHYTSKHIKAGTFSRISDVMT